MAALTATSWTIAYPTATDKMNGRYFDTEIRGKKRYVNLKLTLAATGTIPVGGVPLPTYYRVGMVRNVEYYILRNHITSNFTSNRQTALHWEMNTTGKTLRAFRYSLTSAVAGSSGGRALRFATTLNLNVNGANTFYVTAIGW